MFTGEHANFSGVGTIAEHGLRVFARGLSWRVLRVVLFMAGKRFEGPVDWNKLAVRVYANELMLSEC